MNGSTLQKIRSHLSKGIKIRNQQNEQYGQRVFAGEVMYKKGGILTTLLTLIPQASKDHY